MVDPSTCIGVQNAEELVSAPARGRRRPAARFLEKQASTHFRSTPSRRRREVPRTCRSAFESGIRYTDVYTSIPRDTRRVRHAARLRYGADGRIRDDRRDVTGISSLDVDPRRSRDANGCVDRQRIAVSGLAHVRAGARVAIVATLPTKISDPLLREQAVTPSPVEQPIGVRRNRIASR